MVFITINDTTSKQLCLFCSGPQTPGNVVITAQATNSLSINWTLPGGTVDNYIVNISEINQKYFSSNITTMTTASFTGLYPGRIHVITVTSVAGPFTNTSAPSYSATSKLSIQYYCFVHVNPIIQIYYTCLLIANCQ